MVLPGAARLNLVLSLTSCCCLCCSGTLDSATVLPEVTGMHIVGALQYHTSMAFLHTYLQESEQESEIQSRTVSTGAVGMSMPCQRTACMQDKSCDRSSVLFKYSAKNICGVGSDVGRRKASYVSQNCCCISGTSSR